MRFHVVGLPHTNVTSDFATCAYTEKVRKFCRMMFERGHEVFLYAGPGNEAPVTEHIACVSEKTRAAAIAGKHYTEASFDHTLPHWLQFNANAVAEISARYESHDFICLIAGLAHQPIAAAFPQAIVVEFGIGYGGNFAKYRVWESYAWMHTCYGAQSNNNPHGIDGKWFDAVIPGYLDQEQFTFRADKDDYVLFVGRLVDRKGIGIAIDACRLAGKRLVTAGPGKARDGCEHVGEVGPAARAQLMAGAQTLMAPSVYIEPFGNVVPEAFVSGTPAITTDWGAFSETNIHGVTGFRCRMLREFVEAIDKTKHLDHAAIRQYALDHFSLAVIGDRYQEYFEQLSTLWARGWPEGT